MRAMVSAALALLWLFAPAYAAKRALVVGNDDYQHIDKLLKAVSDAKGYAAVLRDKGFEVREGYDLGFFDLQAAVADFVERIEPGDIAVFVYSGHGWSDGAHNYLVGIDAPGRAGEDYLRRVSLALRNGATGVLDDLEEHGANIRIAIIDACRDNPFSPPSGGKGYGLARGLKPTSVKGSFVIYSAGEGESAMDRLSDADSDPNSVFTRVFLPLLRADLPLGVAIKTAQERVYALANSAGHEQTPAYYDEVRGRTCLAAECREPGSSVSASDENLARMIDAATSADWLTPLIAGLPEGLLKERAKARAEALRKTQVKPTPNDLADIPPSSLCSDALNFARTDFDLHTQYAAKVVEARSRGLSVRDCQAALGQAALP
jgi:caspase domain-containing protein